MRQRFLLLGTAVVAAAGLTACSSASPPPTATTAPTVAPSTSGPSPSPAPSTAPTASAPSSADSTAPATDRCAASSLALGVEDAKGGAAAGSAYLLLTFRNTGSRTCTLSGFPGVSFVGDGNGTQVGSPAKRTGGARTVALAAGRSTTALLRVTDAGNYPGGTCRPTPADGFRVYPPGSTAAAFVKRPVQACAGTGLASPQLVVSSVGTTG